MTGDKLLIISPVHLTGSTPSCSAAFSFYIYDEARRRPTWPLAARRAVVLAFKTLQNVKILKCSHFEKKMPVLGTSEYQCIRIFALISMWLADDQRKVSVTV